MTSPFVVFACDPQGLVKTRTSWCGMQLPPGRFVHGTVRGGNDGLADSELVSTRDFRSTSATRNLPLTVNMPSILSREALGTRAHTLTGDNEYRDRGAESKRYGSNEVCVLCQGFLRAQRVAYPSSARRSRPLVWPRPQPGNRAGMQPRRGYIDT